MFMNISIVLLIIKKPVDNLKAEDFFRNLKNKCPSYEELEQTKRIN